MPNKTCPGCGKETSQTDLRQRDADNNWWHCICADLCLAEWARSKLIKGDNLITLEGEAIMLETLSQYEATDNDNEDQPD